MIGSTIATRRKYAVRLRAYISLCIVGFALVATVEPFFPSSAWAREATVITHDGRSFEGQLVSEDESEVTLLMLGIRVPIPRQQIRQIQFKQPLDQQYAQRRKQLADDDVDGRYMLAFWLFEEQAYQLAQQELKSLGQDFPEDSRVARLHDIVDARMNRSESAQEMDPEVVDGASHVKVAASQPLDQRRQESAKLTAEQINLIKVYEIDLDADPKVMVPPEVIDQILNRYADSPAVPKGRREQIRFRSAPGDQQLKVLFDIRARELYGQVQVRGDPPVIKEFRTRIHQRYVLNYCGTVACHGGRGAGGFTLYRDWPNSEQTVYANFLTLHSTKVGHQDILNRQRPSRSLLLQYGLARPSAVSAHPEVSGWRPRFQNDQDALYQDIEIWIDTLWKPAPSYGITNQSPSGTQAEPLP